MDLIIKENSLASQERDVDIAKFAYDENNLFIEFAQVLEYSEDGEELKEIEVRSKLRYPVQYALPLLVKLVKALIEHELKYKTGYGLTASDSSEGGAL